MNPDSFQQAWQTQPKQKVDADMLLEELKERQQQFSAILFARDVREVGVALFMVPVWFVLGIWAKLPWTWYLTVPVLFWIAGFMLLELVRRQRSQPEATESLRHRVEHSLAEVEHQIKLLRNVFWWYLLPMVISLLAFFGQVAWESRLNLGWLPALLLFSVTTGFAAIVFIGVYIANRHAVRATLEPRRRELEDLRETLSEDPAQAT